MGLQQPCHQENIELKAADVLAQFLPMYQALPCHPKSTGPRGVSCNGVVGLKDHTYRLTYICAQVKPVKDILQDVKHPLEYFWPRGCDKAVICIEIGHQALYIPYKSLQSIAPLRLHHHWYPVSEDRVHHQVKYCGGYRVTMYHTTLALEWSPKVSAGPRNHG